MTLRGPPLSRLGAYPVPTRKSDKPKRAKKL